MFVFRRHRGATSKSLPLPSQRHTHRETCTRANRLFVPAFFFFFLYFSIFSPQWTYLPRYPSRQSTASPWPRHIPALATLTGRCSARRSDRGHSGRCCCTAPGSRLSKNIHVHVRELGHRHKETQGERGSGLGGWGLGKGTGEADMIEDK